MLRLEGIKKIYGSRTVLDIPDLRFQEGVRYGLIGPNGSGKSTLLRILAGVLTPDQGKVHRNLSHHWEMGYMPQKPYAFGFSVLKNVEMAIPKVKEEGTGRRRRGPSPEALTALEAVGMSSFAGAAGNTLSGGEAQRMAFARMLVCQRKILLLDEPTSAADIRGTDLIEKAFGEYTGRTGCTAVVCTHSPAQALRMADEILFLQDGVLVERGPAEKILKEPQRDEVKDFLRHWRM